MDFIRLQTDLGAEFLYNLDNIAMIDVKNCQLYTADNPVYGWTLSQKSMDDLMHVVGPHIVALDRPEAVAKVIKEWNPNDAAVEAVARPVWDFPLASDPLEKVAEPAKWASACEILEKLIGLHEQKLDLLGKTLLAAQKLNEAEQEAEA